MNLIQFSVALTHKQLLSKNKRLVQHRSFNFQLTNYTQAAAVQYFELAENRIQVVECYYHLEAYENTLEIIQDSNEGDGLLKQIGDMYAADGVQTIAVEAYTKFGDIKSAIDLCKLHNKWDQAKDLAKKYDIPEIFTLFTKHTIDLVDQKLLACAIQLNVQTKNYLDAAHITLKLAEGESK